MLVLDSNTFSNDSRGDPLVVARMQALSPADIGVPAIVEYELRYGLMLLLAEASNPRMQALTALLRPLQILPFDSACAVQAARIRAAQEAAGTPIGPHDALIAATVLRHQATLVTRNMRGFSRVPDLHWVNWHDAD